MKKFFSLLLVLLLITAGCSKAPLNETSWQEQYDLGVRYLSEGNYEEAIIAFTAAIEIDPKREEAYVGLADVYYATGDIEKAEEILGQRPTRETDSQTIVRTERYDNDDGSYAIFEFDASDKHVRSTIYRADGTVDYIHEFDDSDDRLCSTYYYNTDGTMEMYTVEEYDTSGNLVFTVYNPNGTVERYAINEFDTSGNLECCTYYNADGTMDFADEFDASGNLVRRTHYNAGGTVSYIEEYDASGNRVRGIQYSVDGTKIWIEEYDASGNLVRETVENTMVR